MRAAPLQLVGALSGLPFFSRRRLFPLSPPSSLPDAGTGPSFFPAEHRHKTRRTKMSVFQDGYLLFCKEDEMGKGSLNAMNPKGEIVKLTCQYLPNKPIHNFPVYSDGLFYACSENSKSGFLTLREIWSLICLIMIREIFLIPVNLASTPPALKTARLQSYLQATRGVSSKQLLTKQALLSGSRKRSGTLFTDAHTAKEGGTGCTVLSLFFR